MEAAEKSDYVAILVTARGGHIGFMDAIRPGEDFMCRAFVQYVLAVSRNREDLKFNIHSVSVL
jgi:predicted alpha/beta-fold hydrolase